MGPQSCESLKFGNFKTPTWESLDKMSFGCGPCGEAQSITIKGKVVASPNSEPWWILWVRICPWLVLAPKVLKLCTNQLVVWFVYIRVSNWCLSFFLIPIPKLQHAPLPPKCYEPRNVPQFLTFLLFHFRLTFEFIKGVGSASIRLEHLTPTLLKLTLQNNSSIPFKQSH
jgi:hypothetical protein